VYRARIDGDEVGLQLVALGIDLIEPAVEFEQRGRANFRAMGEAEEERRRLAGERLLGDRLAILGDKGKGHAEGAGCGLLLRLGHVEGQPAEDGHHDENGYPENDAYGFHHCHQSVAAPTHLKQTRGAVGPSGM
jgi:hypothetical protein